MKSLGAANAEMSPKSLTGLNSGAKTTTVAHRAGLLRSLIRSELARMNAPAVRLAAERRQRASGKTPAWKRHLRRWKNHLGECKRATQLVLAMTGDTTASVHIPFGGQKSNAAAQELIAAGLPTSEVNINFAAPDPAGMLVSAHAVRVLLQALWIRARLAARVRQSAKFINVIFLYQLFDGAFRTLPHRVWAINGDLSPGLIALAAVARVHGHAVVAWQQDYLDFKPLPVSPDCAAVLNESGRRLASGLPHGSAEPEIFWRSGLSVRPINLDVSEKPVGVLLNSQATTTELWHLKAIQARFGSRLIIRFHPNAILDPSFLDLDLEVSSADESIESFVERVGFVFSSTTTTALKAVCLGVPVIQLNCLDRIGFPHLDYVRRGILIGFDTVNDVELDAVIRFYRSAPPALALDALVGREEAGEANTLTRLVAWIEDVNAS